MSRGRGCSAEKEEGKMGIAQDRITELPDTIRLHILSLLPRKSAIRTSVLSTRWNDLWRYRWPYPTILNFGEEFAQGLAPEELVSNINRILQLRSDKKVEIFRLFFNPGTGYRLDAVSWIEYAIKGRVEELYLDFLSQGHTDYYTGRLLHGATVFQLPDCLLNCESLTLLSLKCCDFEIPPDFTSLRFLETLCLKFVNITDDMVVNIIDSCPFLEKLDLRQCLVLRSIRISKVDLRLKSLILVDCWKAYEIDIFAPNLRSFHFNGGFLQRYLFRNVSSLSDVMISSAGREVGLCQTNWVNMIPYLARLKILTLCSRAVQQISVMKESIPLVLCNLQELQLVMELMTETNLSDIFGFFRKCHCPNLEKLFIELPTGSKDPSLQIFLQVSEEEPLECDLSNLKTIKMNSFKGHKNEIELVRFFLEKAVVLESMVLVALEGTTSCMKGTSYIEMDPIHWLKYSTTAPLKFLRKASANARIVMQACSGDDNGLCSTHNSMYSKV